MLRRYSIWIGDTDRSTLMERSSNAALCVAVDFNAGCLRVDVGDDAKPVALIEDARLPRNVGRRIMQPQERLEPRRGDFGDHLARSVGVKLIDHDAVEAGQDLELACGFPRELGQSARLADAPEHQADELAGIDVRLEDARLGLDDEIGAGKMNGEIEWRLSRLKLDAEHPLHRVRPAQMIDAGADRAQPPPPRALDRSDFCSRAEQFVTKKPSGILGGNTDREVGQAASSRKPNGCTLPGMWIGSRSQLERLTCSFMHAPPLPQTSQMTAARRRSPRPHRRRVIASYSSRLRKLRHRD